MPRWLVEIGTPNGLRSRAFLGSSPSWGTSSKCDCGEIGRRKGLKIPRRKACQFDSGQSHQH